MPKIIVCDLRSVRKDYTSFEKAIAEYPLSCRVGKACWIVAAKEECRTLRDKLKSHLDFDDRIFVGEIKRTAAWSNLECYGEDLKAVLER